jgi:hypothetical protein
MGTPPQDVSTKSREAPSTVSHTSGLLESISPGSVSFEAFDTRTLGTRSSSAMAGVNDAIASDTTTAFRAAVKKRRVIWCIASLQKETFGVIVARLNMRRAVPRLAVFLGYVIAASAFTWPLPLHLGTHLTGDPGGDTGVYVWNQWVFRHEAVLGNNPMTTDQILSLTQRADLSQHNYTAFQDLLAFPLMPWLGVVATFNVVLLLVTILTALATYALARRATEATRIEAFIAGVAFAWSPVLVARSAGHFSLVAALPLPAFLLCIRVAEQTRQLRYAALAGFCVALASFCDAYYGIYCVMLAAIYAATTLVRVTRSASPGRVPWVWLLDVLLVCAAGLVAGLLIGRGGDVDVMGIKVSVRGLYTPVLLLTVLSFVRLGIWIRPRFTADWRGHRPLLKPVLVGVLACVGPLAPAIYGLGERIAEGRFVSPEVFWRSSPHGVDLLSLFALNPSHPLVRWLISDEPALAPTRFVEQTAALSLVAMAVVAFAFKRANFRPKAGWWILTLGFAALALGPFLSIGGVNTYVPGPWAFLRYVPIIGLARMPTRFAIVAALGLAMLMAGALAAIGTRWPARRRAISLAVGAALIFELWSAPYPLYSAEISPLFDIVAADPRPVRLLNLPFGVRDGVSSAGNFSARMQFEQTRHGKRLIGGYLSRISKKRLEQMRAEYQTLDRLITLSEGRQLSADDRAGLIERGPGFVSRTDVGYVLIDERFISPASSALLIDALKLRELSRDAHLALYIPER